MPTLGFLKKKRTKDSTGSKDLDSPSSPTVANALSKTATNASTKPAPPTLNEPHFASQSSQASATPTQPKQADSMNPYPQQAYATPQASPEPYQQTSHNVPSIQNLIHPTSTQASNQPYQSQNGKPTNGAVVPQQQQAQPPPPQPRVTKGKYTLTDFQIQRTLGTGSFGRVHLVQSKHNQRFYAVKVLKKAQVVKMKQVEHTNDERRMLQQVKHPFLITLWGTFQDSKNLYMVMDFVEGGELFSLLRKSQVSDEPASLCVHLV
jgi:protein kinase A